MSTLPLRTLSIVAGVHEGAQRDLPPGDYLVGSDAGCDIVLRDDGVAPRHLLLTISRASYVKRIDDAVLSMRGKPVRATRLLLSEHDVLSVGSAALVIGTLRQTAWSAGAADTADADARADDAEELPQPASPPDATRRNGLVMSTLAAIAMLGATLFVYASVWPHPGDSGADARRLADLQHVVAGLRLPELQVALSPKGVATAAEAQQVRQVAPLYTRGTPLVRFHVASELVQRAAEYLDDAGLEVSYAGHGHVLVTGRSTLVETKARAKQLERELGKIAVLDNHAIYIDAPETKKPSPVLPVRIVGVYSESGEVRHFVTDDGTRYFEGSRLSDGAEVLSIGSGEIVFKRAGQTLTYPLDRSEVIRGT
jgi:hypothetical protein